MPASVTNARLAIAKPWTTCVVKIIVTGHPWVDTQRGHHERELKDEREGHHSIDGGH